MAQTIQKLLTRVVQPTQREQTIAATIQTGGQKMSKNCHCCCTRDGWCVKLYVCCVERMSVLQTENVARGGQTEFPKCRGAKVYTMY